MMNRLWTEEEIDLIIEYADKGYSSEYIARLIDRSVEAVRCKRRRLDKGVCQIKHGYEGAMKMFLRDKSLCWLCKKASTKRCRKPVEGFRATPIIVGDTNRISYIVRSCPQYDEEDYVKPYINKYGNIN